MNAGIRVTSGSPACAGLSTPGQFSQMAWGRGWEGGHREEGEILGPGGRGLSRSQPLTAAADQESGPGLAGCVCLHVGRSQAGAVGGPAPKLTHVGIRELLPKVGRSLAWVRMVLCHAGLYLG